jgi:transcription initiation factor TFIIH subunit 1
MQGSQQQSLAEHYPESVQRDLRQLYGSLSELLRHFWSCFVPTPPTTPALQEKAVKTFDTLNKFQQVKLRPFENELVTSVALHI